MIHIGTYGTAVEAAVAYAKYVTEGEAEAAEAAEAEVVEGYTLLRSSTSSTGYRGVATKGGRFRASISRGGKMIHIGSYGTAVEAAVAYAKYVTEGGAEETEAEVVEGYTLR